MVSGTKEKEPTDTFAILDKWIIVAGSNEAARRWIGQNFDVCMSKITEQKYFVRPIFDPTDWLELHIITNQRQLMGHIYYGYIDLRNTTELLHDEVVDFSLTKLLTYNLRDHPQGSIYQHPHPEPIKEKDRDRLDLWRRWVSPDPNEYTAIDDEPRVPDEPEWLASAQRLRRRRGQGVWHGSRLPFGRDTPRPVDDVPPLEWVQQRHPRR